MQCGFKKDISPMKDNTTAQRRHVLYMVAVQLQRGADASARTRAGGMRAPARAPSCGRGLSDAIAPLLSDWPYTCTTEVGAVGTLPRHGSTGHSTLTVSLPRGGGCSSIKTLSYLEPFMIVGLLHRLSEKLPRVVHRISAMAKPQVVFVLGGPGAGKGTQCARIVETYSYTHLSAGDLLREERSRKESEFGQLIDTYIKEGKIVPVEITINLLKKAMDQTMKVDEKRFRFLIDGFPRNEDNLRGWNKVMDGRAIDKFVLFFDCGNDVCIDRCLERGKSSGRTDDNRECLEKRIETYLQSTRPIIKQYEQQGKVHTVDASRSVDEVFADVKKIFDKEG